MNQRERFDNLRKAFWDFWSHQSEAYLYLSFLTQQQYALELFETGACRVVELDKLSGEDYYILVPIPDEESDPEGLEEDMRFQLEGLFQAILKAESPA